MYDTKHTNLTLFFLLVNLGWINRTSDVNILNCYRTVLLWMCVCSYSCAANKFLCHSARCHRKVTVFIESSSCRCSYSFIFKSQYHAGWSTDTHGQWDQLLSKILMSLSVNIIIWHKQNHAYRHARSTETRKSLCINANWHSFEIHTLRKHEKYRKQPRHNKLNQTTHFLLKLILKISRFLKSFSLDKNGGIVINIKWYVY